MTTKSDEPRTYRSRSGAEYVVTPIPAGYAIAQEGSVVKIHSGTLSGARRWVKRTAP